MRPETEAAFDETKYSCTVVIGETVLFLGGDYLKRQISQLTPLGLIRIGTLPFTLDGGTCLVMGSQLFLGFGRYYEETCWYTVGKLLVGKLF